jgi:sugar lactone lactonase YvrE
VVQRTRVTVHTLTLSNMLCVCVFAAMTGNLYVVRNGGWSVVVFSPAGAVMFRIATTFRYPTNLEFGGANGRTLYIVGR